MRFHLVYSGRLSASGNNAKPAAVASIRDTFHAQLEELWRVHRVLKRLRSTAIVPRKEFEGLAVAETPFQVERDVEAYPAREDEVDLTAPIVDGGKSYVPLVRKSLDLNCSLSIQFLRQEDPGELVLQGGDLDNRLKTLFDALAIPKREFRHEYPQQHDKTYCLLESDSLIANFDVSTGRLLFPQSTHPHEVHIVIEAHIHLLRVGPWNLPLLGD